VARKINEDETKILMTGAIAGRREQKRKALHFCMGELRESSRRAGG